MEIQSTKQYDIFKRLQRNRKVNNPHVEKLMASIRLNNILKANPIIVNKNMFIIDGQHRLEAAKNLEIEIYYTVIGNILEDNAVFLLQTSKKWTIVDYINYYAHDLDDYRIFSIHQGKYDVCYDNLASLYALFTSSKVKTGIFSIKKALRSGIFHLNSVDLEGVENALGRYAQFRSFCINRRIKPQSIYNSMPAVLGFCCFAGFYDIDWDRFMSNLEENWHTLNPGRSYRERVQTLVKIYNGNQRRKKLTITYEAFEKASFSDLVKCHKDDKK